MTETSLQDQIAHIVELHDRGIICPGEVWNQIDDIFGDADIAALMPQLPRLLTTRLHDIWLARWYEPNTLIDPVNRQTHTVINWITKSINSQKNHHYDS